LGAADRRHPRRDDGLKRVPREYFLSQGYISEDELEQKTTEYFGRSEVPVPDGGDGALTSR
jgi:hypothetical protein